MNQLISNGSRFNLLPMNSLSREMNRWIDELTVDAKDTAGAPASIWETDTHYFLEFDLPGVVADDVDINIVEDVLHVSANRPLKGDVTFLRQERRFGSVERQFSMPARVDENQIEAELNSGVLRSPSPKLQKLRSKS